VPHPNFNFSPTNITSKKKTFLSDNVDNPNHFLFDSGQTSQCFFFFFNNTELEALGGVKILHDPLESPQTQKLNNPSATFHSSSRFDRGGKEMVKSVKELQVEDLLNAGLTVTEANELYRVLRDILSQCPSDTDNHRSLIWRHLVTRKLLKPSFPHSLHHLLYHSVYHSQHTSLPLYWFPSL